VIGAQAVEIVGVFLAAGDGEDVREQNLGRATRDGSPQRVLATTAAEPLVRPPSDRHQPAADVVITVPRNDLAFDLADLGADRLGAVEASPDCSQQVSAAQPFAQQARVPAKCSELDLTSAENLS
jgi:hypothetical protein